MVFRAYNLCDSGPDREEEIQTLKYAFINQDYPPKDVEMTIQNYQVENKDNKEAEIGVNPLLFHMSRESQRNFAEILQNKM